MIKCPECGIKLSPYCTKIKTGIKRRYYKCFVCSHSFTTRVTESETIELNQNEKKADHKIHLPSTSRVYHGLLKNFKLFFKEVF
ncbi:hypothetical protein C4N20_15815 [Fusobacterium ulcerans]|uniref:InsA N-terminal domain-containing protein n=1 Tax=Fusobacterium ulcerans TaxID=861 RepID=A0AAX2JAR9_9FUSO|nr:hypothetical protein C4N20_15815 [Fusobacterium ulcerans]EFS27000.1 hypothetical protein FUAG_02515 [Fusobacterium ulcerans ATCC 49185]SQJ03982.1 Uncharacterised protein [Fusobacterium ulcerans]